MDHRWSCDLVDDLANWSPICCRVQAGAMLRMIAAFRLRSPFCAFSCFLWQTSFACRHQREQWPRKTQRGAKSLAGWKVSDRARAILLGQIRSLYLGWAGAMVN